MMERIIFLVGEMVKISVEDMYQHDSGTTETVYTYLRVVFLKGG